MFPVPRACSTGGYFLDFDLKRDQLARYGLSVDDAQNVLMSAVGGEPVTTTIEGRERYPIKRVEPTSSHSE